MSFAAFGIDADIAWEDMPPTNKVKDVVEQFAPAPGNYAAVSNAAMNAVQPSVATNIAEAVAASATNALDVSLSSRLSRESQNSTNYTDAAIASATNGLPTRAELEAGWWSEWEFSGGPQPPAGQSYYIDYSYEYEEWVLTVGETYETGSTIPGVSPIHGSEEDTILTFSNGVTATRHRVAAPVPTKPEDIGAQPAGNYLTQHQQLTPMYSQTPTFSEWTTEPAGYERGILWENGAWCIPGNETAEMPNVADINATSLVFDGLDKFTATRTRTDIIGYTLGSQTDKPLQPQGDYAQSSVLADIAETATNALEAAGAAAAASSTNSANVAILNAQVASIGAHLNAEDAHFVSTNYDSVVNLPEAYVEIKMRDESTGSNTWITIWQEMRRWTAFVGSAFDWHTWQGFHTWATNITHELSFKAERCWGIYDSETGGYSPEGFTQISSSNILIAAGMAYQRTVTSGGSVWVLQCNQGMARIGGETNGFFRVLDGDGVTQFEIVKGDKREMGADGAGITVGSDSPPMVTIPYSVEAGEHPTLQVCDSLSVANWKAETDPECIANVSWSGNSGAYVATVQRKAVGNGAMFVKATYMAGGETYIRNVAPVSMDSIIIRGTRYYLGTATISGHTVLTLSTSAP